MSSKGDTGRPLFKTYTRCSKVNDEEQKKGLKPN